MTLGVAREGSEPSLFYDVTRSGSTLSAPGWFLDPKLPELFELELWEKGEQKPERAAVHIVRLTTDQRQKAVWQDSITLEITHGL
jgi:hypothetical protein